MKQRMGCLCAAQRDVGKCFTLQRNSVIFDNEVSSGLKSSISQYNLTRFVWQQSHPQS